MSCFQEERWRLVQWNRVGSAHRDRGRLLPNRHARRAVSLFVCGLDGKYTHFWVDASFIEELRPKE